MDGIRRWALGLLLAPLLVLAFPSRAAWAEEPEASEDDSALASLIPLGFRTPPKSPLVKDGLRWLASAQDARGGWPARLGDAGNSAYDVGVTALAVLAFLGAGYTPDGPEPYGGVVSRGIRRLLETQDEDGRFGGGGTDNTIYNHAYGALAILEAYAMTGSKALREPARRAIAFVLKARNPYFVWRYGVKPGDNDTSVTGAMAVALDTARAVTRAARAAGLHGPFPPDEEAWEGVRLWIDKMTEPTFGRVGYQLRGGDASRLEGTGDRFPSDYSVCPTAIGILLRLRSGEDPKSAPIRLGQDLVSRLPPTWERMSAIDVYSWYFGSQAMFLIGGSAWTNWQKALVAALSKGTTRADSGTYWPAADAWGSAGGPVYTTAMALLCLETEGRCHREPTNVKRLLAVANDAKEDLPFRLRALEFLALRPQKDSAGTIGVLLPSGPKELRIAAAKALGALGVEGWGPLANHLARDRDQEIRAACARALGGTGAPKAAAPLIAALRDAQPSVRAAAAKALGDLREAKAESTPALETATRDGDPTVEAAAREALDRLGAPATPPAPPLPRPFDVSDVPALAAALDSDERRDDAIAWFKDKGAAAVPALLALAKDAHAGVRATALTLLADVRGPAAEPVPAALLAAASDPDAGVRAAAVSGLGSLAKPSADAKAALRTALADPDATVAATAIEAQGKRTSGDPETARALARLLSQDPDRLAVSAARVLQRWALGEEESTRALLAGVDDARSGVRSACIEALAALAPKVSSVMDRIVPFLTRTDEPVFERLWAVFEGLDERVAIPVARCMGDPSIRVRKHASAALVNFGPNAAVAIPTLREVMAARALDPDVDAREFAQVFDALDRAGFKALLSALRDDRPNARASAAAVLGKMGIRGSGARDALASLLEKEPDPGVREAIARALRDIDRARR